MRRLAVLTWVIWLAGSASAAAQANAGRPGLLEGYVPADAIVYVHCQGLAKARATFRETELCKLLEEPDVQEFAAELSRFMDALIKAKAADSPVPWADARLLMDSEVAFALLDVRGQVPEMALVVRADGRGDDLAKLVDRLIDRLTDGRPELAAANDVEGARARRAGPLTVASVSGDVILASDEEALRRLLRTAKGTDAPISKSDRYAASAKHVAGAAEFLTVYLDVERLREQTADLRRAERFDAAGLKGVDYVRMGVAPDAPGVKAALYIHTPQGGSGFLKLIPTAPVDEKSMLASVDEKTAAVAIARLDAGSLYDTILEFAASTSTPERIEARLAKMKRALGFDLRKDLLAALGDEVVCRTLGPGLQFCSSVTVKDRKAAAAAIEKLIAFLSETPPPADGPQPDDFIWKGRPRLAVEKMDYKGCEIVAVKITGSPVPVTPSYAFKDDHLIFATTPQALKTAIDLAAERPAKPLADSDAWRAARSHVADMPSVLIYSDTRESFAEIYAAAIALLNGARGALPPNRLATRFPREEAIVPHLFAGISAIRRDGEGCLIESYGPAGSFSGLAVSLAAVTGFALPAWAKFQENAGRASCMGNLAQLGAAVFQYADRHDGRFPASFGTLLHEGYLTTAAALRCPADTRPVKFPEGMDFRNAEVAKIDGEIEPVLSYELAPGVDRRSGPGIIVLYEKNTHTGQGHSCFFNDGTVRWLTDPMFQAAMAEQKKHLAADR